MKSISLSLVFPAYNEENNIGKLIEEADKAGSAITDDYEIIIVNDGSKDATKDVILDKLKSFPRARLVDHEVNKGYGQTVWDGLKSATKEWVFFSDSDLQFDLKEISKLLAYSDEHKVIIGYRAPRRDPFFRILNAKSWNFLVRLLFGLKVKDIDCAFKLFHRSTLQDMEVVSGGATFSAELLIRLKKAGYQFKQVPVTHLPSSGKVPTGAKPAVIIRAFKELIKLYRTTDLAKGNSVLVDIVKFGLVGAVSTVLDIGALNLTHLKFGATLWLATMIGFVFGTINSYLMNNYWTYRHHQNKANVGGLVKTAIVGGVGLGLTELIMYLLAIEAGMYYNYSKLIAVVIVFFWNFVGMRLFVFRKK